MVSRGLINLTKTHAAVGWVRGDLVPSEGASTEILRLKKQIEKLQETLTQTRAEPPPEAEGLAKGDESFEIHVVSELPGVGHAPIRMSWNSLFALLGPMMISGAEEHQLKSRLDGIARGAVKGDHYTFSDINSFETILIQFKALGLAALDQKRQRWHLTEYGETALSNIRAVKSKTPKV